MKVPSIKFVIAPEIAEDSWLHQERFAAFRDAYLYAGTQTMAIPGLAKLTPEEAYFVYAALARGMGNTEED